MEGGGGLSRGLWRQECEVVKKGVSVSSWGAILTLL